jgi:hypothetical protein
MGIGTTYGFRHPLGSWNIYPHRQGQMIIKTNNITLNFSIVTKPPTQIFITEIRQE